MATLKRPGTGLKKPLASGGLKKPGLGGGLKKPGKATGFGSSAKKLPNDSPFGKARAEKQKQELASLKPYNVKVPVGGSLQVYILDSGLPWSRYEHKIGGGPTSSGTDYPCIKDTNEQCPLCTREGKEGRYVMYLTCVVPVESYEKRDGEKVTRRFSKKLFPITTKMAGKYERLFEKHGSLRGAVLNLSRDNKMDPATGNDVDIDRFLTEAEIKKYATGSQIADREQRDRVVKAKIAEAYEYDKVMPTPKAAELGQMVGIASGGRVGDVEDDGDYGGADDWGG